MSILPGMLTGFVSRDGVPIREGDILAVPDGLENYEYVRGVVRAIPHVWKWAVFIDFADYPLRRIGYAIEPASRFVVVGNTTAHPERIWPAKRKGSHVAEN